MYILLFKKRGIYLPRGVNIIYSRLGLKC